MARNQLEPFALSADEFFVSSRRSIWVVLGLCMCCGCSHPHLDPSGRVSAADIRAGSLPVGAAVCLDGMATYDDVTKSTLIVQDATGGVRFGNVNMENDLAGQWAEVCGETHRGTGEMTLSGVQVKLLGKAAFPKPVAASARDWVRGVVDWKWVEIQGTAYAENTDWLNRASLHMVSEGRRVRVYFMGRVDPPVFAALMGAKVRVQGVARPAGGGEEDDLVLFCPTRELVTVETPAPPADSLALLSAAAAARIAGRLPARRVRLRGALAVSGVDGALSFRDDSGELHLALLPQPLGETHDVEVTGFPVYRGSVATLEGPVLARQDKPVERRLIQTVHDLHALSRREAVLSLPARLRAVVTYVDPTTGLLFVQDGTGGTFIWLGIRPSVPYTAGDMVEVTGTTDPGDYAPLVRETQVRRLGPGRLPTPRTSNMGQLFTGAEDANWVQTEGIVTSVAGDSVKAVLTLVEGERSLEADLNVSRSSAAKLLDARVRLAGVCGAKLNAHKQLVGIRLFVPNWMSVTILSKGEPALATDSETPIGELLKYATAERHRVRVRGVLTLVTPGGPVYMEDATGGLLVQSAAPGGLSTGDSVEAEGFPVAGSFSPVLQNAEIRRGNHAIRVEPADISAEDALAGGYESQLVRVEGTIVNRLATFAGQSLMVQDGDLAFEAHLPDDSKEVTWPGDGTLVRLAGICSVRVQNRSGTIVPTEFSLQLRSPQDITVVRAASWWNVPHIRQLLTIAVILVLGSAIWILLLRKRVQAQTGIIREKLAQEARSARGCRSGQPLQKRVSGQHEPRDPHSHERGDRHDGSVARYRSDTPSSKNYAETVRRSGEALLERH